MSKIQLSPEAAQNSPFYDWLRYIFRFGFGCAGKQDEEDHLISNQFVQCFSYIIDRVHHNSPSIHFRRANTDLGGPIRIQEGQYGFRRADTDSVGPIRNCLWILEKANTKLSMHFRTANTETY